MDVVMVVEVVLLKGGGSLTGAALGAITLPEALTVQPLGSPGMDVETVPVAKVVGVHG